MYEDQDRTLHHDGCQAIRDLRTVLYLRSRFYAMFFSLSLPLYIIQQANARQRPLPPAIINLALARSTTPVTQSSTVGYSGTL